MKLAIAFLMFAALAFSQVNGTAPPQQAPAGTAHSATLAWQANGNPAGTGYNLYRFTGACSAAPSIATTAFTLLNSAPITATVYVDATVTGGATYCWFATSTNGTFESAPSNTAQGTVPPIVPPSMFSLTIQ